MIGGSRGNKRSGDLKSDQFGDWQQPLLPKCLRDPSAADDQIALVKHHGLSGRNRALRLVKGHADFAVGSVLQNGGRGVMAMANLRMDTHWRIRLSAGIV